MYYIGYKYVNSRMQGYSQIRLTLIDTHALSLTHSNSLTGSHDHSHSKYHIFEDAHTQTH